MAKIKLYIAKAQSNNSGAAKGTAENPYTEAEYEAMLDNGTWPGGYVQNLGYCMKEVVISSSYPDSGVIDSDDSLSSDDFDSWDFGSDPLDNSGTGGSGNSNGVTGNNGGHSHGTGTSSNTGGGSGSSGRTLPKEPAIRTPDSLEKAGVRITAKRYILTNNCTVSVFEAQAYGQNGQKLNNSVVKGYFMERPYDAKLAEKSGSKRAIRPGEYNIIPKTPGQRYQWYLKGVPGRDGIAIHAGNYAEDSSGCLLPGTSLVKVGDSNYMVQNSTNKLDALFGLFKMYGAGNISINIIQ